MGQIDEPPAPPPSPPRWPLYAFVAVLAIVALGLAVGLALRRGILRASATPTPEASATLTPAAGSTLTPTPSVGGQATVAAGASAVQRPTNPSSMRVADGSCTVHHITWTWSGARGAISYDLVLYNPVTHAEFRTARTTAASYTLGAGPGATVALKVRSRNGAGTPQTFFTPGDRGRVPPQTTNPTAMTVSRGGHKLTWLWTGARNAAAYDVVLYHYVGTVARNDISARVTAAHWGLSVTPGVTYYLKVRAVGMCAPRAFYTPARAARVGA